MRTKLLSAAFLFLPLFFFAQTRFQHTTSTATINGNSSYLKQEGLDNNPKAIIIIETVEKTIAANPHPLGVWYTGNQWAIFNQDMSPMPEGIKFNVIFYLSSSSKEFVHKVTDVNLQKDGSYIDHPLLNNNPNAGFQFTQNWNPEGIGGVYNTGDILIQYNPGVGKWYAFNSTQSALPQGAAINIAVLETDGPRSTNPLITNPAINAPVNVIANPDVLAQTAFGINLDFEDGLFNWKTTGTAFSNQPVEGNTVVSERVLTQMWYGNGGIGGDYWKNMLYPIGIKGDRWIGTYENGNGDGPTGTITSLPFKVTKRYLHFLLGGGKDINRVYVELQIKKPDYEAAWGAGRRGFFGDAEDGFIRVMRLTPLLNSEDLFRYYFDLGDLLNNQFENKTVRIQIVDNSSGGWGHINVDDFQQSDNLNDLLPLMRDGFSLYADKDKPVWGFADLHAHWTNHIGLRGLMHGVPGGNWQTSKPLTDIPSCDGFNHGLPTITPGLLIAQTEKAAFARWSERMFGDFGNLVCGTLNLPGLIVGGGEVGLSAAFGNIDPGITTAIITNAPNPVFQACGYALIRDVFAKHYNNNLPENNTAISNFVDYPRWNTMFHQLMHITWVRRSWEGGQRLMVVPVGTAKSWEYNTTSDGSFQNQKNLIEQHVSYLKNLVQQNNDWLEIAYTSRQARQIILNGKMAVVIGLEQAEIGNYGFASAQQEVSWLYDLGIHHIFPIHNIDNKIGGAAIFNSNLTSYQDLVHRQSQDGPIVPFSVRNGWETDPQSSVSLGLSKDFMRQGIRYFPVAGFGNIPFFYFNSVPAYERYTWHKNALGLTPFGEKYITELMKKGMIIDVDHMSDLAQDRVMLMLKRYHYPMMAGHANFRELRRQRSEKEEKKKTEFTLTHPRTTEIYTEGGVIGIMTQQNDIQDANQCPVPNNAAGSTASFAQAYCYTLQHSGGYKGIAFGSDFNGFAPQTAPRFGVDAAYFLEGDNIRNIPVGSRGEDKLRRTQAFQQRNGVRYDVPIKVYHYHRFPKPAFLTSEEREIWEALAIAKSGTDPELAWQPGGGGFFGLTDPVRTGLQINKVKNLAHGFRTAITNIQWLDCPEYIGKGDCPAERKATFMCVHGAEAVPANWRDNRTMELYRVAKPIYDLWLQFENGPNEPLRRSFAYPGGKDFDFNLDGLAHYGMFPDLIQDMKNNGLSAAQLRPLFLAPEEFIKMWEKAETAKSNVKD